MNVICLLILWHLPESLCLHEVNHDSPDHMLPNPHKLSEGKCPYQPLDIKTKFSDFFDHQILDGIWKVIYDEKSLNKNYTCMGTKFIDLSSYNEDTAQKHNVIEFMQSFGVTETFRKTLFELGDHRHILDGLEDHDYFTNIGRQLNFSHPIDSSIGFIEAHNFHSEYLRDLKLHLDEFDHILWDSQFLRYSQVIDSDLETYLILYTC